MRSASSTILAGAVVAGAALWALLSCDSADPAEDAPLTVRLDSTSSATPGTPSAVLTEAHPGWKKAGCLSQGCHDLAHGSKSPAGCSVCHGDNGAPRIPATDTHGMDAAACATCHASAHPNDAFQDPIDCTTCHKFAPSTSCPAWREFDIAVIGAGGGGLSAAAALSRAGKKVVVLEKHHKVGGYMTSFERMGYRFEVSLHGFDGLADGGMNVDIFKALGIYDRVKPVRTSVMYRAIYPDFSFDVPENVDAYRDKLVATFPAEAEGIKDIFDESLFMEEFISAFSKAQAGQGPMPSDQDLLRFQEYTDLPLSEFLARHVSDPKFTMLFTQLAGFAGAEPGNLSTAFFMAMWNSYHRHGFHFFEGGSQAVTNAMADVVRENGGTIRLGTLATKVAVEGGNAVHVETRDDACYRAQFVVSNAPAPLLINELVGREHVAAEDLARYDGWKVGLSAFVVYLGVNHDYRDVFANTHEIMITDSYDPAENFATIDACDVEKTPFAIANYTLVDPTDAPAGKNVIEITGQLGYDCGKQWFQQGSFEDYKAFKDEMGRALVRRAEAILPGLSRHVEVFEVGTPRTMAGFTLNPRGTIFGWDAIISQTMMNRMDTQQLGGIDNLYIAGAWTFPGGGQSAVITSGAMAASSILARQP